MENLGVDNIKKTIGAIISIGVSIIKAKADDDKISMSEAIGITVGSIPKVFNSVKNFGAVREEYNDLDDTEREDIKLWVREEFDLSNDYVEEKIEAGFEAIVAIEKFFAIDKPGV